MTVKTPLIKHKKLIIVLSVILAVAILVSATVIVFVKIGEAKLREETRAAAEAMLRSQAAIDRIVILEGLEADSQEIAEALAVICRQNDMTMEQLKPYYDAEFEKAVVRSVLSTKATKLIRDAAIITETA